MTARLTIYPSDQPVQSFLLDPRTEHVIGRGADCSVRVCDSRLSRRHARAYRAGDRWLLTDLDSKNGIQVDGRTVATAPLEQGCWISFGGVLASFEFVSEPSLALEREHARIRWQTTVGLGRRLDPHTDVDTLLRSVLDSALELAGAERGYVMLLDPQGELTIRARAARGGRATDDAQFAGSAATVHRVLSEGRPVVAGDVRAEARLAERPSIAAEGIRALVCLPLPIGDRAWGTLYLDSSVPGKVFTALDLELLEAFAAHAALVVGVASVRDELAELSALLPREPTRNPGPPELVRRLQEALPACPALVADANPA